jgi:hypothetical protein
MQRQHINYHKDVSLSNSEQKEWMNASVLRAFLCWLLGGVVQGGELERAQPA